VLHNLNGVITQIDTGTASLRSTSERVIIIRKQSSGSGQDVVDEDIHEVGCHARRHRDHLADVNVQVNADLKGGCNA
jgi:hypothetical protein